MIIRAVPTQYSWTNPDGTTWTSTDPGKLYDDGGEPFTFPRVPEHRTTFTLTTPWRGEFSTNGGATWREAPGTATTTSASTTVHVYNPHTHRVDCDLYGNCINGAQGGGNQKTTYDPDGDGILNYLIPDDKIDDYLTTRDGADHALGGLLDRVAGHYLKVRLRVHSRSRGGTEIWHRGRVDHAE